VVCLAVDSSWTSDFWLLMYTFLLFLLN
jgi:hypothetical protein